MAAPAVLLSCYGDSESPFIRHRILQVLEKVILSKYAAVDIVLSYSCHSHVNDCHVTVIKTRCVVVAP